MPLLSRKCWDLELNFCWKTEGLYGLALVLTKTLKTLTQSFEPKVLSVQPGVNRRLFV